MRDPNEVNSSNWAARGPLMPRALKKTIKTPTTQSADDVKDQPTDDLAPTASVTSSIYYQKKEDPKKSFEKRAEALAEKAKLESAKKESLKPEERDWKPLDAGAIDFSKHDIVNISNTKANRYQMDKGLKKIFTRSGDRSAVISELGKQITSSGKLTKYSAKHALWKLQKAGKLTQGQVNRTFRHLGI